jgi:hypothetical protein
MKWKPTWWKEQTHGSGWSRVREAMRRDWEQTKNDLHVGGHYMNQEVKDTVKQMSGKEPIPAGDQPNPPKVIGDWNDIELPMAYGYGARREFGGDYSSWNDGLDARLRSDWDEQATGRRWDDVRGYVRHGFERGTMRSSRPGPMMDGQERTSRPSYP